MNTTKKFDVKDIVKQISKKFIERIAAGEVLDLKRGHMNAKAERKYSSFAQVVLSLVIAKEGFMNNKWLGFKQVNSLKGQVLKGSKSTIVPFSSMAYKYERPNGNTFTITAFNREEADKEAFKKDPAAKLHSNYFVLKYHRIFNVEQTSLSGEFAPTPGFQLVNDSMKARELIKEKLDPERDFFEQKLLSLLGASFMTLTRPTKEEIILYQVWLSRLEEKPTFLYALSSEAGRLVEEILDDVKAGRVVA